VKIRKGKRLVTDGPYCETREQTGGSYLIECTSIDEAIEWAMKMKLRRVRRIAENR